MDWISVSEKLPPEKELVLVYSPADGMGLAERYMNDQYYWVYKEINGDKTVKPTHWMKVKPPGFTQEWREG